jgi:STE24 endopeptidase
METITLDKERQIKAREYARIRRRLMLVNLIWNAAYAALWLLAGWAGALRDALLGYTANVWLLVAAFAGIYGGISALLTTPLSYYSGFVLPHRYELSTQTFRDWVVDGVKGLLVGAPIGLLLVEVIYAVLRAAPETWWLWAGGFLLAFNVLLANLAPVLIAPLFNKYVPLGEEHADLAGRLIRLAERANTKVQGVFKFDMSRRTKAANAALAGLGNTRRIILGDTLIDEFSTDEIETVLAHELGHHVNRDIPAGIAVGSILTLGGLFLASLGLAWGIAFFGPSTTLRAGFEGPADVAALPLLGLVIGAYSLITMPLSNGYSRWRERRADEYALQATNNGAAYASALTRLANQNLADADPEPWVEWLLHSHPALRKRIAMAEGYKAA